MIGKETEDIGNHFMKKLILVDMDIIKETMMKEGHIAIIQEGSMKGMLVLFLHYLIIQEIIIMKIVMIDIATEIVDLDIFQEIINIIIRRI